MDFGCVFIIISLWFSFHYYVVKKTKLLHGEGIFNIAWEQVQVSTTNLHMGCDRVLVQ